MKHIVIKKEKPWGWENWIEVNKYYVVKEIYMKAGNSCSLQYHEKKHESFYVVDGVLKFCVGTDENKLSEIILKKNGYYTIEPLVIHRMEALEDSIYIESSTNFLEDVVRIKDNYGRI